MDLFGMREHDARHDEGERQLRRLIEQVAQLSIDLGVTRTDIRRLSLVVEGKVDDADVDEAIVALNERVKQARVKLQRHRTPPKRTGQLSTMSSLTPSSRYGAPSKRQDR
jgi:hypothetical protein